MWQYEKGKQKNIKIKIKKTRIKSNLSVNSFSNLKAKDFMYIYLIRPFFFLTVFVRIYKAYDAQYSDK